MMIRREAIKDSGRQTNDNHKKKEKYSICECNSCGIEFQRLTCKIKNQELQFCCRECSDNSKRKGSLLHQQNVNTTLKKYGVENVYQAEFVKEKIKKSNIEKYGVENVFCSSEVKEKIKLTNFKNYGSENVLSKDSSLYKGISQKLYLKYGGRPLHDVNIREKVKRTCLERYNVDNIFKLDSCKKNCNSPESHRKRHETKKRNKTYGKSKIEDEFYDFLCAYFSKFDVDRHVTVNNWDIDFYVKSVDVYVQFDGVYWHGLNRSIDVIKEFKSPRDKIIYRTFLRDQEQNEWFKKNKLKLIRVTDKEFNSKKEKFDVKLKLML